MEFITDFTTLKRANINIPPEFSKAYLRSSNFVGSTNITCPHNIKIAKIKNEE